MRQEDKDIKFVFSCLRNMKNIIPECFTQEQAKHIELKCIELFGE